MHDEDSLLLGTGERMPADGVTLESYCLSKYLKSFEQTGMAENSEFGRGE